MELSIIIVSYNTEALLRQCLNSLVQGSPKEFLRNSTGQAPFKVQSEIIVVDNGSTDGSVDYVKSIMGIRGTTGITGIRLIENKENLGFSRAVNQGIKQAEGKTILLLNSDTQVSPDAIRNLLEFEEKVKPAIVGARMLNPDGIVQGSCFFLPTVGRAISEYWLGKKKYFSKFAPEGEIPVEVEAVSGGAMLISREVINKIGNFDERYFMYFEDLDYCRRAKRNGYKVYYLPSAEIIHEHGASGKHLADSDNQWKRLIPSSKVYHGPLKYYIISFIIRTGRQIGKKC